jgi:hypothetical protein
MKTNRLFFFCAFLLSASVGCAADTKPEQATEQHPEGYCDNLNGSWEMISMNVTTADSSYTQGADEAPTLKILNDTHWMFIRQSAERFVFAQGGPFRLEEGKYYEEVGYSAEPGNVGNVYTFECRLEGDSLWHHKGDLGGIVVDETWRRVQ